MTRIQIDKFIPSNSIVGDVIDQLTEAFLWNDLI